jgi:hypothetical protein
MRRLRTRGLIGFAVVAIAMAFAAAQAMATVVDKGFYSDEPYSDSYSDCGFPVDVEGTSSGHFRIRAGKGKTESAFFVSDNYSYTETHTNVDTGAFVTITGNAIFNEIKATHLTGNLFEFEAVEAGQPFELYDSDGNLVARDRGSIHHHAIFDTGGDNVPGAILIEELDSQVHGPHPGFDDFCGLITPLIGS